VAAGVDAGPPERVVLGYVSGVYGIKGWVKVVSFTRPLDNILEYPHWWLKSRERDEVTAAQLIDGRAQSGGIVVQLATGDVKTPLDRDRAAALIGRQIEVERDQLPKLRHGQYYWADLVGMAVESKEGAALGSVTGLIDNGAQDVLVLEDGEQERLIPFVVGPIIQSVDLAAGRIVADWAPDY
jgi:16S rRNA processing protein RimM